MRFFVKKCDQKAIRNIGRAAKALGNTQLDGGMGCQGSGSERGSGFIGQKTLNFTVFVARPQKGGHAAGFGGFRDHRQAVDAAEKAGPFAMFDVLEVDAVGISRFDGLRGGETSVLTPGQLVQFFRQLF